MRKAWVALVAVATFAGSMVAVVTHVSAAGDYVVSINDATAVEGSPVVFTLTVTPTPAATDEVRVKVGVSNGSATGGEGCPAPDYLPVAGTIVFTQAEPSRTLSVQTCDDAVDEQDETFFVNLTDPTVTCGGTSPCTATLGDGTGLGTITDNDAAGPPGPGPIGAGPTQLSVVDVVATAGRTGNCLFSVNRTGDATGVTTVGYASAGRSRLVDNVSGTLVFGAGETVKSVLVDVLKRPQRQRFVTLILSGATNGTIIDGTGVCEIRARRHRRR